MDAIEVYENRIAKEIYFCALKVHRTLGPGLLESAYEECLCYELRKEGFLVEKQKPLPLIYGEIRLDVGLMLATESTCWLKIASLLKLKLWRH